MGQTARFMSAQHSTHLVSSFATAGMPLPMHQGSFIILHNPS